LNEEVEIDETKKMVLLYDSFGLGFVKREDKGV
jgi:hypothetical protein